MSNSVEHIRGFHAELTAIRRDIHAYPELGFKETRTSQLIADRLADWGIEVHRGLGKTGVVGLVRGRPGTGAIGLRADMDCLPIHETGDIPHKSRHPGRMHACGHDGHTTMLLGAGRYLAQTRNFAGTVYLIFQPAEEGGGGGRVMVEEGLFKRFPASQVYALHNWPSLPPGKIAVRAGPVMAAVDEISIALHGKGGHAAIPQHAVDPVVVSAHVITALQTIVSRNVDPLDAVVVSICSMETGQDGASNVIPDEVRLLGTVRTFREETRGLAERRIREIADRVAAAFGASAEVQYRRIYPATVNAEHAAAFAAQVGERIFGHDNVIRDANPSMTAEDFSYMLQACPGAYVWLGQGSGPRECELHNAGYDFNDEVIPLGAGYLAAIAEAALAGNARDGGEGDA